MVGNSIYYNYSMSNNGQREEHGNIYSEDYFIDVVKNRSMEFIADHHENAPPNQPFFVTAAVPGVHEPADPAPQHANYSAGMKAPRNPNYNKVMADDNRHWMIENVNVNGSQFNETVEGFVDLLYRRRLAVLQSIDDFVEELVLQLESIGELSNTYIIYTSDNGYHLGEFAVPIDKRLPYESDVRVPTYVRGPGVRKGHEMVKEGFMVNVDISPTLLRMSGAGDQEVEGLGFDGSGEVYDLLMGETEKGKKKKKRTTFLLEYEGENFDGCFGYLNNTYNEVVDDDVGYTFNKMKDGINCGLRGPFSYKTEPLWEGTETFGTIQDATNNTYNCVREIDGEEGIDMQFCKFVTGEVEIYDLVDDPYQLSNLYKGVGGGNDQRELDEWERKLKELKECEGGACSNVR